MTKTKELSVEIRSEIVAKFKCGVSASELSKFYKISRKTVYNLVKKKNSIGNLKNLKRTGRKPVLNQKECRRLLGTIMENPSISPVKVAAASENIIGKKVRDATLRRRMK